MITLPFHLGWNAKKVENLILSCHHEFNHGLFREIKMDFTREKPKNADDIDDLFGEWCASFVFIYNSSQLDVLNYIETCRQLLPDIVKFGRILTREWTRPYKMPTNKIAICEKMTILLDKICYLLESLEDYNTMRLQKGLEPVEEIGDMKSWKNVVRNYSTD